MKIDYEVFKEIENALECSVALDIPWAEGRSILQKHGYDYSNRFELSPTEFVADKIKKAYDTMRNI